MPVVGACRLCLAPDQELQESHIVPRWAYKRIRGTTPGSNPNPVHIHDGRAVQMPAQVKEHLLCRACEQRLGIDDKYASTIAFQADGSAPFLNHVRRTPNASGGEFSGAEPTTLETDRLARFGTSVIWRAHVAKSLPDCNLGDRYGDEVRRFLLGGAFPENAACVLIFIEGTPSQRSPVDMMISTPVSSRNGGYHTHRVMICGLHFEIAVGGRIDPIYRDFCVVRQNPCRVLISTSELAIDWIAEMVMGAKPVGSMARRAR